MIHVYLKLGKSNSEVISNNINPLPHRDTFSCFSKQSKPRSGSSCKSCLIRVYSVCLWKYDISDPTLVELTSNLFVSCTNMKMFLSNYP